MILVIFLLNRFYILSFAKETLYIRIINTFICKTQIWQDILPVSWISEALLGVLVCKLQIFTFIVLSDVIKVYILINISFNERVSNMKYIVIYYTCVNGQRKPHLISLCTLNNVKWQYDIAVAKNRLHYNLSFDNIVYDIALRDI